MARDLRTIYQAATLEQAETALDGFAERWDKQYPTISRQWRKNWDHVSPFFAFPRRSGRSSTEANAIESMNRGLRKIIKTRGALPTDEAARKLL